MFTIFTEHLGLVHATAQGVRKPGAKLKGHLEPYSLADLVLVEARHGYRLTVASLISWPASIIGSEEKLKAAEAFVSVIRNTAFEAEDSGLWDLSFSFFTLLKDAQDSDEPPRILLWALVRFLNHSGYRLSADEEIVKTRELRDLFLHWEEREWNDIRKDSKTQIIASAFAAIARSFEMHFSLRFLFLTNNFLRRWAIKPPSAA